MDPVVSSLLPTTNIGAQGAQWWVGQIEEVDNPKHSNRFRVRVVGAHSVDCGLTETKDLPWATCAMPVNIPYKSGGAGGSTANLEPADWVLGMWLDQEKTKPIILMSLGATANAEDITPPALTGDKMCLSFKNHLNPSTSPVTTLALKHEEVNTNKAGTQIAGGSTETYSAQDLTHRGDNSPINPFGTNVCVAVAQAECNGETKKDIKYILGELFRMVQDSGGNLGDYLVNKVNGELFSYADKAYGYINKIMRVIRAAMARIRGTIIGFLKKGVDALVKMILSPFEGILESVQKWLSMILEKIGCSIEDIMERLTDFVTSLIFDYLLKVFRSTTCQVDIFVNAILNKIMSFVNRMINSILGPIQSILKVAGGALNIVGGAMFKIMNLLGISCGGVDSKCGDENTRCTKKVKSDGGNFLDDLLDQLTDGPLDYGQSVCDDARGYDEPEKTGGIIYGGLPAVVPSGGTNKDIYGDPVDGGGGAGTLDPGDGETTPTERLVNYEILKTNVWEGDMAYVVVNRTGYLDASSAVSYKTVDGSAIGGTDYISKDGIIGFGKNQTQRVIGVQTIRDRVNDTPQDFTVEIDYSTGVAEAEFISKEAKVTIGVLPVTVPGDPDPYTPPFTGPGGSIVEITPVTGGTTTNPIGDPIDTTTEPPTTIVNDQFSVSVTSDKLQYKEGEFITFTISSEGVPNGTLFGYSLFGANITQDDIVGGNLYGTFTIEQNKSIVVIGVAEDAEVEGIEDLQFSINGTGAVANVQILGQEEKLTSPKPPYTDPGFKEPTIGDPIVDDGGRIIEIPIDDPGDPYILPPKIAVTGQGWGAIAVPLLDIDGRVSEIRITQRGSNYVTNKPQGLDCVLDSLTLVRPGLQYTVPPTVYINGNSSLVSARINDNGFVSGFDVIDRTTVFTEAPKVEIVGDGFGAFAVASIVCLDTQTRDLLGYAKIGTGRYVDCPT